MGLRSANLEEINSNKVHGVDVADLVQSWKKDGALELRHCWLGQLNVECVYAL